MSYANLEQGSTSGLDPENMIWRMKKATDPDGDGSSSRSGMSIPNGPVSRRPTSSSTVHGRFLKVKLNTKARATTTSTTTSSSRIFPPMSMWSYFEHVDDDVCHDLHDL